MSKYPDYSSIEHEPAIRWHRLKNKTILITGCTGLIGRSLIFSLLHMNTVLNLHLQIIALVRDLATAEQIFAASTEGENLKFIKGDVSEPLEIHEHFDYVIHGASPTASKYIVAKPVETIKAGVIGTTQLLDHAMNNDVQGFIFLSSMEVYGTVTDERLLSENDLGYLNPLVTRSSYAEAKRMSEAICHAYAVEYSVPAMSIRLAQTFGAGVSYSDTRVFAMMARSAIENKDIVLNTTGRSKHPYLSVSQAAGAILTVLTAGEPGEVYNAANPETYCSISEMGRMVAEDIAKGRIKVITGYDYKASVYPDTTFWNLDVSKITKLGWEAKGTLKEIFLEMIYSFAL